MDTGTDEKTIIEVVTASDSSHRQQIRQAYTEKYGEVSFCFIYSVGQSVSHSLSHSISQAGQAGSLVSLSLSQLGSQSVSVCMSVSQQSVIQAGCHTIRLSYNQAVIQSGNKAGSQAIIQSAIQSYSQSYTQSYPQSYRYTVSHTVR